MPHTDKKKANKYRVNWGRNKSICECGQMISNGSKYSHVKSKNHIESLTVIDSIENHKLESILSRMFPRLSPRKIKRIIAIILD
jgi:plastocyanin domain-containing protein